jgi:D-glycero-D-manno-heptose 1,7-bisphosphate phosphatase
MARRAVFLDLNGTLVMPVQVTSPDEYTPLPECVEAVRLLNQAEFLCPVITVQSRIEKGIYSEQAFLDWFGMFQAHLQAQNALLVGPYVCPHRFASNCACHKPQPTLYLKAAEEWNIDCQRSFVVGDSINDIRAGQAIGAKTCFVRTGWASRYVPEFGHEADFIGDTILAVAQWILKQG